MNRLNILTEYVLVSLKVIKRLNRGGRENGQFPEADGKKPL